MAKNESGNREKVAVEPVSEPVSEPVAEISGPPGDGIQGVWIDEFGRTCIGSECFYAAADPDRKTINIIVDENGPCGGIDPDTLTEFANAVKAVVGEGGDTSYTMKSKRA